MAGPANWAAAGPGTTKMPEPMMAPTPSANNCGLLSTRANSGRSWPTSFQPHHFRTPFHGSGAQFISAGRLTYDAWPAPW